MIWSRSVAGSSAFGATGGFGFGGFGRMCGTGTLAGGVTAAVLSGGGGTGSGVGAGGGGAGSGGGGVASG